VALIGGLFLTFGGLTAAAAIDNRIGWRTDRDEALLRRSVVNGRSVEQIVGEKYRRAEWTAYHADELYRSVVDCDAVDASGREVHMSWEVAHWYTPRPDVKRRSVFITALNREAAELTPTYAVPDLPLRYYPIGMQYSEAIYGLASKKLSD
jgi:hypothetical protein